ncbi:MAG: Ig-like domain-containing protein [Halobacteriales archaeon]
MLLVNPPAPPGTLSTATVGTGTVRLANATAVDGDAADFLDGDPVTYGTKALVYEPGYHEYAEAPTTVYSTGVVANHFADESVVAAEGELLQGDRLSLVLLAGNLSASRPGSVSVSIDPASASTETLRITGDDDPVTLRVPTRLSADRWRTMLAEEFVDRGGNLVAVTDAPGSAVRLVLNGSETYTLQVAKLSVGESGDDPGPAYLTRRDGDNATVDEGTGRTLTVQVRDRYNNPVEEVTVEASANRSGLQSRTATTDADGVATFRYVAPEIDGSATHVAVNVSFAGDPSGTAFDAAAPENVSFEVTVLNSDRSGVVADRKNGTAEINPGGENALVLVDSEIEDGGGNANDSVTMTLENTHGANVTVVEARYNFYSMDSQGVGHGSGARPQPPSTMTLDGTDLTLRGPFEDVTVELAPGNNTVTVEFSTDDVGFDVVEGDFYVLSVVYTVDGTTRVATYFVAPS